jgi:DNA topoisomerase III
VAEIVIKFDEETRTGSSNSTSATTRRTKRPASWSTSPAANRWAPVPSAAAGARARRQLRLRKGGAHHAQATPSCDFKTGKIILQQPVAREQMSKLLETGKTDLLDKFVSMRTRRAFKAFLAWDKEAGKVNFEFAPSKFPPRKTAAGAPCQAPPK